MIKFNKQIWFNFMKSVLHSRSDSLSHSLSPSTHLVRLQSGLTLRVSRLTSSFLIACWDLCSGQGPVKIVWIGRWGKSCDFSASLPLRCVHAGGRRSGTHPRWINGGRWLDRTMVTRSSSGGCTERALSNYLIWARLQTERKLAAPRQTLAFMFYVHSTLEKCCALSPT